MKGIQSTLNTTPGTSAAQIETLGWVLYAGGAIIFVAVVALATYGALTSARRIEERRWLLGAGLLFPVITLSALLLYSISVGNDLHTHADRDALRVRVTAKQWWWDVRYETEGGVAVSANELHLPVGRSVELILETSDVIHSFWVPSLAGKVDMIPGRSNRLVLRAMEAGVHRGQCAEYCGLQHALMAFFVVAESPDEFDRWLALQAEPIAKSTSSGLELFLSAGCAVCHAIRGTNASGTLGPDLTHVGGRRSLAAGVLSNHVGTMAAWVAGPQEIKPGNVMPATTTLDGQELRTLAEWLGALK